MSLTILAGMKLTAARLNRLVPVTRQKSGDTSRSSTISRTADPDLVLPLLANTTYDVDGLLVTTSAANAAGDFSYELQWPAGAVVTMGGAGPHNQLATGSNENLESTASAADSTSPSGAFPYGASTVPNGYIVKARVVMGGTAGNLTLAWAQVASNANATVLKAGSWLTAQPVDGTV